MRTLARTVLAESSWLLAGHRGNSSVAPENTLPALVSAIQVGCPLVELDYHHSSDRTPMVFHDETLDRTTDAVGRLGSKVTIESRSSLELAQLDAGSWFSPEFKGTRIPSLDTVLDALRGIAVPLIERKAGDARTCFELLQSKGMIDQIVLQAFDWDFLASMKTFAPSVLLGGLGEGAIDQRVIDRANAMGLEFLGWNQRDLTAESIQRCQSAGLWVSTWTVDDADRAEELVSWGARIITSNVPSIIRRRMG